MGASVGAGGSVATTGASVGAAVGVAHAERTSEAITIKERTNIIFFMVNSSLRIFIGCDICAIFLMVFSYIFHKFMRLPNMRLEEFSPISIGD
jgi:phosphate/sulfate permease